MFAAAARLGQNSPEIPFRLLGATVIGAGIVGLAVPMIGQPWIVLVSLAAVAGFVLFVWRLELGMWAFILATALNRYNFEVVGWQMKIEHMVLVLVLVAWGLRFLSRQERLERWPLVALIGAFLGLSLFASIANSPDLYKSIRILTRMGLAVVGYVLIVNHVRDSARLWQMARIYLAVAAGAAVYGIIAAVAWRVAGLNIGLQYNIIDRTWYPYGTLWEANIFGAYVMSACTASLVLLLSGQRVINRWFLSVVFTVTAVAMLLSLARASWVGFGVSAFFIVLFMGKFRFRNLGMMLAGSALVLLVLSSVNPGGVFEDVTNRFQTLGAASQETNVISRLTNSEVALRDWQESRWLGWGIDGFHINHPEILSALPSPQLNALYDTGLLGAILFATLILAFMGRAFAVALSARDSPETTLVIALSISFLGLFVAFQATDAFWLGFTWVHLALLMAAVRIAQSKTLGGGVPMAGQAAVPETAETAEREE